MTVVDKYANKDVENGKLGTAAHLTGNKVVVAISTFTVSADDEAGSIYRVFPEMNPCLIPIGIKIMNEAIGTSSLNLGLYEGNKGEALAEDCLYEGLDLGTAHAKGSEIDGLSNVDVADIGKQLFELAGHTIANRRDTYDIALTVKTAPGAEGTITVVGTFVQG